MLTDEDLDKIIDRHFGASRGDGDWFPIAASAMLREAISASWVWRPMDTAPRDSLHLVLTKDLEVYVGHQTTKGLWMADGAYVEPIGWLPIPILKPADPLRSGDR